MGRRGCPSASRRRLVISHGLGEHGGRYADSRSGSSRSGYAVYALDHRGHGRSGGDAPTSSASVYVVSDLGTFVGRAQRAPGRAGLPARSQHGRRDRARLPVRNPVRPERPGAVRAGAGAGETVSSVKLWLVAPAVARGAEHRRADAAGGRDQPRSARWCVPTSQDPLVFHGAIPARTLRGVAAGHGRLSRTRAGTCACRCWCSTARPTAWCRCRRVRPLYDRLGQSEGAHDADLRGPVPRDLQRARARPRDRRSSRWLAHRQPRAADGGPRAADSSARVSRVDLAGALVEQVVAERAAAGGSQRARGGRRTRSA